MIAAAGSRNAGAETADPDGVFPVFIPRMVMARCVINAEQPRKTSIVFRGCLFFLSDYRSRVLLFEELVPDAEQQGIYADDDEGDDAVAPLKATATKIPTTR